MKSYVNVLAVLVIVGSFQAFVACSPAKPITDPVGVTKAVFDAINNKQAEKAGSYFAEDAEFVAAFGQPVGNAKILNFLKTTVIPYKMHIEITDISDNNGTVTGSFTLKDISAYQTPTNMQVTAVIADGKIKSMTWSPKK